LDIKLNDSSSCVERTASICSAILSSFSYYFALASDILLSASWIALDRLATWPINPVMDLKFSLLFCKESFKSLKTKDAFKASTSLRARYRSIADSLASYNPSAVWINCKSSIPAKVFAHSLNWLASALFKLPDNPFRSKLTILSKKLATASASSASSDVINCPLFCAKLANVVTIFPI